MIHAVTGDILLSKAQLTAHGVAPNDHFDSGLAMALRERWPGMVKDFRHWAKTEHPKAGSIWVWSGPDQDGTKSIANLLTQEGEQHHGARPGKATLSNVHNALKALATYCEDNGVTSLALPRLATGVGGLSWDEVEPFVREFFGAGKLPVYVYTTFRAGVAADEG